MYIAIGIIFIVISLVLLISPDTVFAILENMKKNSNKELSDSYRLRTRICGGVCLLLGICLLIIQTFPTKEDLISTPSTHKEVQYIQIGETKLGEKEEVEFVLYDPECDYIQVCIAIPKSLNEFQYMKNMAMYVDDVKVESVEVIYQSSIWKQYVIILFEDMEGWNEMRLERDGYVVEFQSSDIEN